MPDRVDDVARIAVGRVEDDEIDPRRLEERKPRLVVLRRDGGADDEPARLVGGRAGEVLVLLHVLHGDEAGQPPLVVDDGKLLDAVSSNFARALAAWRPAARRRAARSSRR